MELEQHLQDAKWLKHTCFSTTVPTPIWPLLNIMAKDVIKTQDDDEEKDVDQVIDKARRRSKKTDDFFFSQPRPTDALWRKNL